MVIKINEKEKILAMLKTINVIRKDCTDAEKRSDLTAYGAGQLDLIRIILAEIE